MASHTCSRFLSAHEVEEYIREAGPVFHIISTGGKMPREILSPYDTHHRGGVLDGFALRPPGIFDKPDQPPFSARVHSAWIQGGGLAYNGVALPGIAYNETTGIFRLDSLGPGSYPGEYFLNATGLHRMLESLSQAALREAVKQHLTEGGDERLHLDPATGGNKYFCPPHPVDDAIFRGSCTCSPPSRPAFEAACRRLGQLWRHEVSFEEACDDVRARMTAALGIQTPHHIVLHPSGTDSEFTPLLIAASRAKSLSCTGIINVVVGAGEVGRNTANAAGGCHFSEVLPLGEQDKSTTLAASFENGTQVVNLKARRSDGALVPNFDQIVLDKLADLSKEQERPFFVVHAVDGSKLGSHITSRSLVTEVQSRYGDRVLVVLDSCQARTEREELDWYLSHQAVILITGSKFYGAPGFCAAAVVPKNIATDLVQGAEVPKAYGNYLTKHEVPAEVTALHTALPGNTQNMGLLLRWECGVTGMERVAEHGTKAHEAIRAWVERVEVVVRERAATFEVLVGGGANDNRQLSQLGGVNSIISFKVLVDNGTKALGCTPLRLIHEYLTRDVSDMLPPTASDVDRDLAKTRCFIGQPVDLGDFAILRLAMGASLAVDLAEDMSRLEASLLDDARVLDKIEMCLRSFDALRSG